MKHIRVHLITHNKILNMNKRLLFKHSLGVGMMLVLVLALVGDARAGGVAANKVSSGTGNWSTAGTWNPSGVPTSTQSVRIDQPHTVTVDGTYSCQWVSVGGGNGIATLTFASGSQLTATDSTQIGDPGSANRRGVINMTSGGTLISAKLVVGNANVSNAFTSGTGTVQLTATNTIPSTIFNTFNHLTISGGTTTFANNKTIGGELRINSSCKVQLNNSTSSTADKLFLNGVQQAAGTWGSTSSAATNKNDTYFQVGSTGILTVATGGGCAAYTATIAGDATICAGGSTNLTVTMSGGATPYTVVYTDGMGNTSTVNSYSSGSNISVSPASTRTYTLVTVTDNASCTATNAGSATVTVVADPAAPTATKSPNVATVCAGQMLTLTGVTDNGGGTGTCNIEYSHNGGAWTTTLTPFAATVGSNTIAIRKNCNGSGCDISTPTTYTWTGVADPAAPTATKSPNVATVCAGQTLTLTGVTDNGGGTGTCNIEYRHSTDGGTNWSAWSTTPSSFAAVVGTNTIQIRKNCDGSGCDISGAGTYSWTVVAQPVSPTLDVKTPNTAAVCAGTTVSATFNAGSGGTGCSDDYVVIIDGGSPAAYMSGNPVGGSATTSIVIQGRRANCDAGSGCTGTSYTTLASWTVNANPTPSITVTDNSGTTDDDGILCAGDNATLDAGAGYASYSWSGGGSSQTKMVNTAGAHDVTVTDGNGCEGTASTVITVNALPDAGTISGSLSTYVGLTTALSSDGDSGGSWESDDTNIATVDDVTGVVTGVAPGTATITYSVTDGNGCFSSTSVVVTVLEVGDLVLSIEPPATANCGEEINVDVVVNTGFVALISLDFFVHWDTARFAYVDADAVDIDGDEGVNEADIINGNLNYSWAALVADMDGVTLNSADFTIMTLTLRAKGCAASTDIVFANSPYPPEAFDINFGEPNIEANDGTVSLSAPPLAAFAAASNISIACADAPPTGSSLSYTNGEMGACEISGSVTGVISGGPHTACGGSYTETWTFTDACMRTIMHSRTITVDPAALPTMTPLADVTVACGAVPSASTRPYSNGLTGGCEISGTSNSSTFSATPGACGGTVTETWTATDACGRTLTSVSRTITVDPAPQAQFAAVSDITVSCNASLPPTGTTLSYTNGESGGCLISGSATGVVTGSYTTCGDMFTETWTFTDACSRTSTQSRTITVVSPAPVSLTCPPPATEVECQTQTAVDMAFTNWLTSVMISGGCNIVKSTMPAMPVAPPATGGSVTVTWTVTSDCESPATCSSTFTVTDCIKITGTLIWKGDGSSGVGLATVNLSGPSSDTYSLTPSTGTYEVNPTVPGMYTVTPVKNDPSPLNFSFNGVDVADATAIQQHLTGNTVITDFYVLVAADCNNSKTLSTVDAALIRQGLLGNPSALAILNATGDWRFIPTPPYFPNPSPAGPFVLPMYPTTRNVSVVASDVPGQDFYGIKTGDVVEGHANPALKPDPDAKPLVWRVRDRVLKAGETVELEFSVANFTDIAAFQHALRFDPAVLEYMTATGLNANVKLETEGNFGAYRAAAGELRTLWSVDQGVTLSGVQQIYRLRFKALQGGKKLSEVLALDPTVLNAVAYTTDLVSREVQLVFADYKQGGINPNGFSTDAFDVRFDLFQNRPNPFSDRTAIGFMLPKACDAQLRVFDISGRELWRSDKSYPAGYHEEVIRMDELDATGVLFYELTTPDGKQTRKMMAVRQ